MVQNIFLIGTLFKMINKPPDKDSVKDWILQHIECSSSESDEYDPVECSGYKPKQNPVSNNNNKSQI